MCKNSNYVEMGLKTNFSFFNSANKTFNTKIWLLFLKSITLNISNIFLNCLRWNDFTIFKAVTESKDELHNIYSFSVYENLNDISCSWKMKESTILINPWLSFAFQENVSSILPKNLKVIYGSLSISNEIVGYFPIYLFDFFLDGSLQFKNPVKKYLGKLIKYKILLMGQLLATGLNYPLNEFLKGKRFQKELNTFIQKVAINYGAKAILWKDFFSKCDALKENGYFSFSYQPAMILTFSAKWQTMKDYELSLSSKYRVRLQRARNKMKEVIWLNLSEEEIVKWQSDLYKLYTGVVSEAVFNMATVPESFFSSMKKTFKDEYNLVAGFFEGELICFYSTLVNGETLEANLAGFKESSNLEKQLYLNMLFLMIEDGIRTKAEKINFYRTAMEIKSSVGAKGYDTLIYIKPTSKWMAPLFPVLIPWFSPKTPSWQPRSPFKLDHL